MEKENFRNELNFMYLLIKWGFPGSSVVKNPPTKQEIQVQSWVTKIPWRRKCLSAPVFLPGKSHGKRSLAGHSPQGFKRVRHDLVTKQQLTKHLIRGFYALGSNWQKKSMTAEYSTIILLLLLLSHFSSVQLCVTP